MTTATGTKKVQRGAWYKADGSVMLVKPVDGKAFSYNELCRAVGGYFESVRPTKDAVSCETGRIVPGLKPIGPGATRVCQVWANEEGLLKWLPRNPHTATVADMRVYELNGYPADWQLSGDVLVVYNVPMSELVPTEPQRVTL